MNKLLIKIPTRERGFDWLDSYLDNITNQNTRILLSLDSDEHNDMYVGLGISGLPYPYPVSLWIDIGDSKGKIEAINRDINDYIDDFDVLLVGSDDMIPQVKGFDQIILDDMKATYPDGDGCLWYDTEDQDKAHHIPSPRGSDRFLRAGINMLPVMGKTYYKRFNYVYHPSYKSFWCDNEYTDIARRLKKITWVGNRIIKHYHPAWESDNTFGMPDKLYSRNDVNFHTDMSNYNRRKQKGFYI